MEEWGERTLKGNGRKEAVLVCAFTLSLPAGVHYHYYPCDRIVDGVESMENDVILGLIGLVSH